MESKRGSILYVLNVLKKYTDEKNILSMKEIINKIEEVYNAKLDRRTVSRYIDSLIEEFDYDISKYSDNGIGYYLSKDPNFDLELGEVITVIEQISSSPFLDKKTKEEIINKFKLSQNEFDLSNINQIDNVSNINETSNREVIKNVEDITKAINLNKKIVFDYFKYTIDNAIKEKLVSTSIGSPILITYKDQQLYLLFVKDKTSNIYSYRIDRMKNIRLLNEDRTKEKSIDDAKEYMKSNVSIFGGNPINVTLKCNMFLLDNIIEMFGKNNSIEKIDEYHFKVELNVDKRGIIFYILRNIEYVEVLLPTDLRYEVKQILEKALNKYKI